MLPPNKMDINNPNYKHIPKEKLYKLYCIKELPIYKVANVFKVCDETIVRKLKFYNIIIRSRSESMKGKNNPFYGKTHSNKTKEKLKNNRLNKTYEEIFGVKKSKEAKKLISSKNKIKAIERWSTEEFKLKMKIIDNSIETKTKRSNALKKRWMDESYRLEMKQKSINFKNSDKYPNYLKQQSIDSKNKWKNEKYKKKMFSLVTGNTSIENKIKSFLKELNINFIQHYFIKDIKYSYHCDFYLPDFNLIIEADGDYWHGNEERFKKLNGRQVKQRIIDKNRTLELESKGFKVLRLWETYINKLDVEKFKSHLR